MSNPTIEFRDHTRARFAFVSPYIDDMVERLRDLPKPNRRWDSDLKAWVIHYDSLDAAAAIAFEVWGDGEVNHVVWAGLPDAANDCLCGHAEAAGYPGTGRAEYPSGARFDDGPYAILHLLPTAPKDVVKAVRRQHAIMNHPDHGGDGESMSKINRAYEEIMRALSPN